MIIRKIKEMKKRKINIDLAVFAKS